MTKEQSLLIKGIAILMMIFLHLFNKPELVALCNPTLYVGGDTFVHFITRVLNPVGIYLMLSGYGLYYSFEKGNLSCNTQEKRLLKLYIHFWLTLIIFVGIGSFVNPVKYPGDWKEFLLNFTSYSSTYNGETWFLFPYLLLSLSAYPIFKIIDKVGVLGSLIITGILYILSRIVIIKFIAPTGNYDVWYHFILTYVECLAFFVIGALFCRTCKLREMKCKILKQYPYLVYLLFVFLIVLNCFIATSYTYYAFGAAYVYLILHINFSSFLKKILCKLGEQSMIMWLIHTYICRYLFSDFIYGFKYPILIFLVTVSISYLVSLPIGYIARKIIRVIPFLSSRQESQGKEHKV